METKKESDHRSLTLEQLIVIAWYRSLDELTQATIDLFISSFQEGRQSLNGVEAYALLDSIQERPLLAA
jgi:hypothetical protein